MRYQIAVMLTVFSFIFAIACAFLAAVAAVNGEYGTAAFNGIVSLMNGWNVYRSSNFIETGRKLDNLNGN
jgi:hypothetical protein